MTAAAPDHGRFTATRPLSETVTRTVTAISSAPGAWCPSLSPDGERVAYICDSSGVPRVVVAALETGSAAITVSGPDQEAISVAWSPDGEWLAYLVSPGGSIRAELHVVRPDGRGRRLLAGGGEFETAFAGAWSAIPGRYAFSIADGHSPHAAVWFVDARSGALELVSSSVGIGFCTVTSVSTDGTRLIARCGPRNQRRLLVLDAVGRTAPLRLLEFDFPEPAGDVGEDGRFAPDGRSVFLRTGAGRDRSVLGQVPIDGAGRPGRLRVLARRADADLEGYAIRDSGRSAVLVWNVGGESHVELIDFGDGTRRSVPLPGAVMAGWSLHRDGRSMIAEVTDPITPRTLWHLTLPAGVTTGSAESAQLTSMPPAALPPGLVRPTLHRYVSSDGTALHGWLYRPTGSTSPGPTVVALHGGPESQERPAFSLLTQSLVAAGLTVFAPNVRGSTGYGNAFAAADDGAARADSFQDVPATVQYLVDARIARPGSIGVQGWSYGGYLALTALARWPELFAAGGTHAGMSDLLSFFSDTEPWMAAASVTEYGDPATQADLLRALSPLTHLHNVRAPTLLVHGDQDTNVPVVESVLAHAALRAAQVPTELLLLPGEGHTIVGTGHRAELAVAFSSWFVRWLVQDGGSHAGAGPS